MHYIVLILAFITTPAMAQIMVDDGIRTPKSMVVGGSSVIDDGPVTNELPQAGAEPAGLTDEDKELLRNEMEGVKVIAPILPESPSAPAEPTQPKPNVKRVVKPYEQMKIRRSIADDRIDDSYVQEMVKDNYLFTPTLKNKKP